MRFRYLVRGNKPRAERPKSLAALALGPLAGAFQLEGALGDVVGDAIAGDVIEGVLLRDIACAPADHHRELDFPVSLLRPLRQHGLVVRADDAVRSLVEDDRLLGDRHAGFRGMVGIVQSDRDVIADVSDAGPEPRAAAHQGELVELGFADLGEAARAQGLAGDIGHDARKIADAALAVEDAGFFAAGRAVADELHWGVPS